MAMTASGDAGDTPLSAATDVLPGRSRRTRSSGMSSAEKALQDTDPEAYARICEVLDGRPAPAWLYSAALTLEAIQQPLPPELEADPEVSRPPSPEVCARAFDMLLSVLEPDIPEPYISTDGDDVVLIGWSKRSPYLRVEFYVELDDPRVWAYSTRIGDIPEWDEEDAREAGVREKILRSIRAIAAA